MSFNLGEAAINIYQGAHTYATHVSQHANPLVNALVHSIMQDMPQMVAHNIAGGLNDVGQQAIAAAANISHNIGRG